MSTKHPIPLFPINLFLLPGERAELYIFEERYKKLVEDCITDNTSFGITFSNKLNTANYGCLVKIKEIVHKYPNGEMDIIIEADLLFRLEHFLLQQDGKPYPGGSIHELPSKRNYPVSPLLLKQILNFRTERDMKNANQVVSQRAFGLFDIALELGLTDIEKLEFAEIASEEDMNKYLINYIHYLKLLYNQEKAVFRELYLN